MPIKAKSTPRNTLRQHDSERGHAAGAPMRVRLEGAPWLSLRDRCGEPDVAHRRAPRASAKSLQRASSWRSLSRLEVAMALVLVALVTAVFQGTQSTPRLALRPQEPVSVAASVSLIE